MIRIDSYEDLTDNIVGWLKDYYFDNDIDAFVIGVSGGIDSAVVSSLCARTGLPTYVVCMPLESKFENSRLSDVHSKALEAKYDNVKRIEVELFSAYDSLLKSIDWWTEKSFSMDIINNNCFNNYLLTRFFIEKLKLLRTNQLGNGRIVFIAWIQRKDFSPSSV